MAQTTDTTHFGFENVPLSEKQGLVNNVFHKVADRYDVMNDVMSAGMHRLWKSALVNKINPSQSKAFHSLDVAGGTGDVAFRIAQAGCAHTRVTVCDINAHMLTVGEQRARKQGETRVDFMEGNAEALPFEEAQFNAYSIAFGIRNVPRIPLALKEAYRVIQYGSVFACLEFSHVDMAGLDAFYKAYSFNVIPKLGKLITGDAQPYQYLVESIQRFPRPQAFEQMIKDAGFSRTSHTLMSGGIVALHVGWKL